MAVTARTSRSRVLTVLVAILALVATTAAAPGAAQARTPSHAGAAGWDASPVPYLGWSSWSLQATRREGVNPQGNYSWLTEQHVLAQARFMARHLKRYGYEYVNIDAGWWRTWDWTPVYDAHGRPAVWSTRFPDGMARVVRIIHRMGLKVGIYLPAGMEVGKEGDNATGQDLTKTVAGAPQCTLADAIYPDRRTTNGWNSSYALDFDNGNGCAKAYVDSLVDLFSGWGGVDLLKLDGAGPGSGHDDITGDNSRYDNRPELAEYDRAFRATGRHVELQGSWNLSIDYAADWQRYLDSWRTSNDVECYCDTLTRWSSVASRLANALQWARYAGPRMGWSNLDSLEIGNGAADGLTRTERRTAMTIWAMAAAPIYLGDDLTDLDHYGLKLATNRAVLAIDQDRLGATLTQVTASGSSSAVARRLANGDLAVALVNLGDERQRISTDVASAVGATGARWQSHLRYALTDLYRHRTTWTAGRISRSVPAHGSVLVRVRQHSARPAHTGRHGTTDEPRADV